MVSLLRAAVAAAVYAGLFGLLWATRGGEQWARWLLVLMVLVFYAAVLSTLLLNERTRAWVVGFSGHRPLPGEHPQLLPWAVALWSVVTAVLFGTLRDVPGAAGPPGPPPIGGAHGMLGSANHAFFAAGWRSGLYVFGIAVDLWWEYALVCVYQLTRAVLGSMVDNIFTPFYSTVLFSDAPQPRRLKRAAQIGRALTSVFTLWSVLTDILLSAAQADLFLFTVLARVSADTGYSQRRIEAQPEGASREPPPPPPVVGWRPPEDSARGARHSKASRRSRSPGSGPVCISLGY